VNVGDSVVVVRPTKGLPAFKVSGKIYTVDIVEGDLLRLKEITNYWEANRFEQYKTKRVN
jgi:hypothetical protein